MIMRIICAISRDSQALSHCQKEDLIWHSICIQYNYVKRE
jgi:hypothetical protein